MIIEETNLDGILLIKPIIHQDNRGYFFESFRDEYFKKIGLSGKFTQDNQTKSNKGTLRGLHYQLNYPQGKLVRVSLGEVYDVAVDVRKNSPTFGKYFGTILSDLNHMQMYIPPGFAHGYTVRSEIAIFQYKCTDVYHPEDEYGIRWDDPELSIDWKISNPIISNRDIELPLLSKQLKLPLYNIK